MLTKYIKVDDYRPSQALQKFAHSIAEAARDGFTVSDDIKYHARELSFGQFEITLVKAAPAQKINTTGFLRVGEHRPQETTLTSSAKEGEARTFVDPNTVENPFAEDNVPPAAVAAALQNPVLAHLDSIKSKQDLLDFAAKYGITIPEDVKIPTAIKKYLREKVANTA